MPKAKKKRKCKYEYEYFFEKICPHEALEGKDVCYWHEEREWKNPREELEKNDFEGFNLSETYLQGARLLIADLQGAVLGGANLKGAVLGRANLQEARLWGANLQEARLWEANLQEARLWEANLQGANLWEANLQGANLGGAKFQGADLRGANLQGADLWEANFKDANLYKTIFDNSNLWEVKDIDEMVMNERNGDKEQDIEKRKKNYEEALQIYRNLKNYFKEEGIYPKSGDYHYRENIVQKKIYKLTNKWKWIGSQLLDLLCGYGEKPQRIIFSSLVWIFFNSIIFFLFGIERGTTKISISLESCLSQNLINYLNCLYFSIGTFATLGYGDFHPLGITKAFAVAEAFSGIFMFALFVLTMGRKMMR